MCTGFFRGGGSTKLGSLRRSGSFAIHPSSSADVHCWYCCLNVVLSPLYLAELHFLTFRFPFCSTRCKLCGKLLPLSLPPPLRSRAQLPRLLEGWPRSPPVARLRCSHPSCLAGACLSLHRRGRTFLSWGQVRCRDFPRARYAASNRSGSSDLRPWGVSVTPGAVFLFFEDLGRCVMASSPAVFCRSACCLFLPAFVRFSRSVWFSFA